MASDKGKFGSANPPCRTGRETQRSGTAAHYARRAAGLFFLCILAGLPGPPGYGAQNKKIQAEFLIARRQVQDPFFRQSVVLMLPLSNTGLVVGLIINKPTRVALGKLFPKTPEFKDRTEPAYFGGPVDVRIPSVVFRWPTVPEPAIRLYGNVYLTFDSDLISKVFQNRQPASKARLFLGRAQWSLGQLHNEIRQGGWYEVQADGDLVFSANPNSLWPTLHERAAPSKYIKYPFSPGGPQPSTRKAAAM